jgi:flagellar basal body-associated protein FliL
VGLPDLSGWNGAQLATLIIVVFLIQSAGIAVVLVRFWGARGDARDAKAHAEKANQQTVNTGNGFAKTVKDSLNDIKDSIADLAVELRADNARLENRLDKHMNNHDRRNNNA